ncbi:hypothetical protein GCM10007380_31120 [Gottfriedia solisilvae]|uniref:Uncharacterized protein n=1 Tax=Gottfriedia solisilvae TaxID=1516104 RepID=A0A8J3F0K1_9BACI|nr:hypothetical protein GCM10007380_31120 [Gottfriedia solisilvae]
MLEYLDSQYIFVNILKYHVDLCNNFNQFVIDLLKIISYSTKGNYKKEPQIA